MIKKQIQITEYTLEQKDIQTIKNVLQYARHRLLTVPNKTKFMDYQTVVRLLKEIN